MPAKRGEPDQSSDERSTVVESTLGEKIFTTREVADYFKVAEPTVRDWINRGELRAIRLGGKSWFVPATSLELTIREKSAEQEEELQRKRLEAALQTTLKIRAELEPDRHWALARCVLCGLTPVLTTRRNRIDGEILCTSCAGAAMTAGLTKDACDRAVAVELAERNLIAEEDLPYWEVDERALAEAAGRTVAPVREW